jgi:hypothetical protein
VVAALLKRTPSTEVKFWLSESTAIEVREAAWKAESPILVTLAGMAMEVSEVAS